LIAAAQMAGLDDLDDLLEVERRRDKLQGC